MSQLTQAELISRAELCLTMSQELCKIDIVLAPVRILAQGRAVFDAFVSVSHHELAELSVRLVSVLEEVRGVLREARSVLEDVEPITNPKTTTPATTNATAHATTNATAHATTSPTTPASTVPSAPDQISKPTQSTQPSLEATSSNSARSLEATSANPTRAHRATFSKSHSLDVTKDVPRVRRASLLPSAEQLRRITSEDTPCYNQPYDTAPILIRDFFS